MLGVDDEQGALMIACLPLRPNRTHGMMTQVYLTASFARELASSV